MNLSHPTSVATTLAHRAARRVVHAVERLRPGSTFVAALAALPGIAHAGTESDTPVYAVVTAFGVLVAAAIITSVASSLNRRDTHAALGEQDYAERAYGRD